MQTNLNAKQNILLHIINDVANNRTQQIKYDMSNNYSLQHMHTLDWVYIGYATTAKNFAKLVKTFRHDS
jgi:hypothetical protein